MWLAVARPAPAKFKPALVEKQKREMLRESIYLKTYVYRFILSSCFRMKSCKTNLVICFRKLDDQLRSIDTSPTDEDTRTPDLPLDRQIRIGTGIQYDWNKDVTVGAAYEYLDAGEAEIDQDGGPLQGPLKGEYDTNAIHFFAVNLIWKF